MSTFLVYQKHYYDSDGNSSRLVCKEERVNTNTNSNANANNGDTEGFVEVAGAEIDFSFDPLAAQEQARRPLPCVRMLLSRMRDMQSEYDHPETYDMLRMYISRLLTYEKQIEYYERILEQEIGFHIRSAQELEARMKKHSKCLPTDGNKVKRPKVGVCMLQQSNGADMQEYVSHYLLLGVSQVVIYDNNDPASKDGMYFRRVMQPFVDLGYVEIRSEFERTLGLFDPVGMFQRCYHDLKNEFDWIGALDSDEYFVVENEYKGDSACLTDILLQYEQFGGLTVNWKLVGSAMGHPNDNQVMLKKLKYSYPDVPGHIKTFYQPRYVSGVDHQHYPLYVTDMYGVSGSMKRVDGPFHPDSDRFDHFSLYHFYLRDWDYCFYEKVCSTRQHGSQMYVSNRVEAVIPSLTNGRGQTRLKNNRHEDLLQTFLYGENKS